MATNPNDDTNQHKMETRKGKVMEVGQGKVILNIEGGTTLTLPANVETEQWAGRRLYTWVRVMIRMEPDL